VYAIHFRSDEYYGTYSTYEVKETALKDTCFEKILDLKTRSFFEKIERD